MTMISYAQNREDVLLNRLFPPGHEGFYIDIGASHPCLHSVTKHFYDRGWRGINIEPVESVFNLLRAERPRDVNLNIGLSDFEGSLTFYEAIDSLGMSTFSRDFAGGLRRDGFACIERTVSVTTLARVCEQYAPGTIDFLKIDVESHERAVIAGGDWRRWRPRVVVIESTGPEGWSGPLLEASYLAATCDGLNTYFIREEDRDLLPRLARPVGVFDDYIPHEHHQALEDLRQQLGVIRAQLDQAQFELWKKRMALDEIHGQYDTMKAQLERLSSELEEARTRLALLGDLGPRTILLARRLRGAARRIPGLCSALRGLLPTAG
ncbi:MAG: FkbM family methyltransferase [Isosphaeraceae bacterium]|nr:FkbM family methyltransferase [Isosphaeraceae bacterium]